MNLSESRICNFYLNRVYSTNLLITVSNTSSDKNIKLNHLLPSANVKRNRERIKEGITIRRSVRASVFNSGTDHNARKK